MDFSEGRIEHNIRQLGKIVPRSHGWDASPSAGLPPEKSTVRATCLKNTTQRLHRNRQPEDYTLIFRPPYHATTRLTQLRTRPGKKTILVKAHNRTEILPAWKLPLVIHLRVCDIFPYHNTDWDTERVSTCDGLLNFRTRCGWTTVVGKNLIYSGKC